MPDIPASPTAPAWSSAQLVRLEAEWRGLRRAFAFHPHVEVFPLAGDPPAEYQVLFKVTTLGVDAAGQLAYVSTMPVHVWLPPHFPREAPVVRPMEPTFHPNVSMEWVHLSPGWRPNATLTELVTQVGQLLAFQTYDANAVLNPVALNWVYANLALLPTDPAADLSPDAGGEPLVRIAKHAPAAIDEQRRKVEAMCDRLVSSEPPAEQEVRKFASRVRTALAMYCDPDIPAHIRGQAGEVEETALSMQGSSTVWAQIRRQVATAEAAGAAVAKVAAQEEALMKALAAFDAAGQNLPQISEEHGAGGRTPLANLPPLSAVQPPAVELRRVVRESEHAVADLRARLAELAPPPRLSGVLPGRMLSRRLQQEVARATAAAEPARGAGAVLASVEPVLERTGGEAAAADRVAAWAEYADLMLRSEELLRRLTGADPARLHAFFASTPAGEAGPFEYEQRIDFGGTVLAVSNPRGTTLRVIDAATEEVVASGEGTAAIPLNQPGRAAPTTLTVQAGERSDELRVQMEYLLTQTREALGELVPKEEEAADPPPWASESWAGRIAAALGRLDVRRQVLDDHRRASQRWKALLGELAAFGRFKNRVATYHLLARLIEFVPRAHARVDKARDSLARAEGRLADIAARSARDMETNRPIVPQHLAAEYANLLAERDRAHQEIDRMRTALHAAAERARVRLTKMKLLGSAELPALRILAPLPPALSEMQVYVTDEALDVQVRRLGDLLRTNLRNPAGEVASANPAAGTSRM
jgi:hypothetical protein